jgi:hypothetical protein
LECAIWYAVYPLGSMEAVPHWLMLLIRACGFPNTPSYYIVIDDALQIRQDSGH